MSGILYDEKKEEWQQGNLVHLVQVQVRRWTCKGMTPDVVIESQVMVDGHLAETRKVYPLEVPNAKFIRMGIAKFDELVASHPFFSQEA